MVRASVADAPTLHNSTNLSHNATSPSDPSLLRAFYQRLFPYRPLFHWLNHSAVPSPDFTNREFAFTANGAYIRYQSFASADLFRKQCVSLIPSRFEIGPVYSTNPRDRKILRRAAAFKPVSKELVFDVDLTDYDEIRTCCSKATICHRCWAFMRMAIRVIDATLREDFGFCHILWVYSGRRGIHAWVCDRRAREMGDEKRRAIAGYMELLKGGDATKKKVNMRRPLHPHVEYVLFSRPQRLCTADNILTEGRFASFATHLHQTFCTHKTPSPHQQGPLIFSVFSTQTLHLPLRFPRSGPPILTVPLPRNGPTSTP